jgi:hypothetical protein
MVSACIVLVASGCSLFTSLDGLQNGSDAGDDNDADAAADGQASDARGGDDATPPLKLCDPGAPFATVSAFPIRDDYSGYRITLTSDELDDWFASSGLLDGGGPPYPISHGTRTSTDASFTYDDESAINAVDPAVSADGLRLFYAYNGPIGELDLGVATKANRAAVFPSGLVIANVNSSKDEIAPFESSDGALWFCSDRARDAGDNNFDVYRAAPAATGFSSADLVSELSAPPAGESGVILTQDLLTVYVTSNRTDIQNLGGIDIYRATRASVTAAFGPLTNVIEINSSNDERATWISLDNCRLYLESNRSMGYSTIYRADKTPPP